MSRDWMEGWQPTITQRWNVERGQKKHTYSRRRVFWDAVVKLMARGYMADSAIDRISGAYGRRLSVTQVINQMKKDRMLGIERWL